MSKSMKKGSSEVLQSAREHIISNARCLAEASIELFEAERYGPSCFLAMTSIEEVGKLFTLRLLQISLNDSYPSDVDKGKLKSFLHDHTGKAISATADSLFINSGADRRQGVHPISGKYRTSGIMLLARSEEWMSHRSSSIYTDIILDARTVVSPAQVISRSHAYYFVCMAYEVLAEQAESG